MGGRKIGYARVSTDKQSTDQQVASLDKAGCHFIFTDNGVSAAAKYREGLEQARQMVFAGDVFVVTAIDRVFRSTIEAIQFLDELMKRGVEFQSLTQSIDTRTPEGRKWFIDTASWAEYEKAIISRRTKERLAYAKAKGQRLGRPLKLNENVVRLAYQHFVDQKATLEDIAAQYNVSSSTLKRSFERYNLLFYDTQDE